LGILKVLAKVLLGTL